MTRRNFFKTCLAAAATILAPAAKASPLLGSWKGKPRLVVRYRGRTVLSGLLADPGNWFMSSVDEPRNFEYAK